MVGHDDRVSPSLFLVERYWSDVHDDGLPLAAGRLVTDLAAIGLRCVESLVVAADGVAFVVVEGVDGDDVATVQQRIAAAGVAVDRVSATDRVEHGAVTPDEVAP